MLGLLVIAHSGTYAADLDEKSRSYIYLAVFVLTFVLPGLLIPILLITGLARSLHFSERRERLLPMYIVLLFYITAYLLIRKLPVSQVYQIFLFSASLSIVVALAISYFWKISTHLIGWGGLTGLILALSFRFDTDLLVFLVIVLFCSGLVGYARLRLNAHSSAQVYAGFFLGLCLMMASFLI